MFKPGTLLVIHIIIATLQFLLVYYVYLISKSTRCRHAWSNSSVEDVYVGKSRKVQTVVKRQCAKCGVWDKFKF